MKTLKNKAISEWRAQLQRGYPIIRPELVTPIMRSTHAREALRQKHLKTVLARSERNCVVLPLDAVRALAVVQPHHYQESGVYFLWRGPRLVYVGSTLYVGARCQTHRRENLKDFTHATFVPLHQKFIRWLERQYIRKYRPQLNSQWCAERRA